MDKILNGLQFTSVLFYFDDICITSHSFDRHLHDIDIVLSWLEESVLKLGPKKWRSPDEDNVFPPFVPEKPIAIRFLSDDRETDEIPVYQINILQHYEEIYDADK